jgi:hypothetical protein
VIGLLLGFLLFFRDNLTSCSASCLASSAAFCVVFAMGYFGDLLFVFRDGLLVSYLRSWERFLCQKRGLQLNLSKRN